MVPYANASEQTISTWRLMGLGNKLLVFGLMTLPRAGVISTRPVRGTVSRIISPVLSSC